MRLICPSFAIFNERVLRLVGIALGDLVDVAHDEHDQLVRLEVLLRHALHVVGGNCTNTVAIGGPVVRRSLGKLVLRENAGDLCRRWKSFAEKLR